MIQSRQQLLCTVSPPISVVFLLQVVHFDAAGVLHVDFGWVSLLQTHNPDTHYLTPYSCLNYRTTADNPPTVTRQIRPNIKTYHVTRVMTKCFCVIILAEKCRKLCHETCHKSHVTCNVSPDIHSISSDD